MFACVYVYIYICMYDSVTPLPPSLINPYSPLFTPINPYPLVQFRFLTRLLLVHGSWNYSRLTKLILFSFYKNICLIVIEVTYIIVFIYVYISVYQIVYS